MTTQREYDEHDYDYEHYDRVRRAATGIAMAATSIDEAFSDIGQAMFRFDPDRVSETAANLIRDFTTHVSEIIVHFADLHDEWHSKPDGEFDMFEIREIGPKPWSAESISRPDFPTTDHWQKLPRDGVRKKSFVLYANTYHCIDHLNACSKTLNEYVSLVAQSYDVEPPHTVLQSFAETVAHLVQVAVATAVLWIQRVFDDNRKIARRLTGGPPPFVWGKPTVADTFAISRRR